MNNWLECGNRLGVAQTRRAGPRVPPKGVTFIVALMRCIFYTPLWGGGTLAVGEVGYKHSGISTSSVGFAATFPKGEGCVFVPLLLLCDRYCLSAGREAPPYGFVLRWCRCLLCIAFSDSRGRLFLRFVSLPLPCGRYCLSAGREAPPHRFVRRWCCCVLCIAF